MKAYPLERKTASMKQFMRQPIFDNRSKVFKDIAQWCTGILFWVGWEEFSIQNDESRVGVPSAMA